MMILKLVINLMKEWVFLQWLPMSVISWLKSLSNRLITFISITTKTRLKLDKLTRSSSVIKVMRKQKIKVMLIKFRYSNLVFHK
jgi:hypothetical protein